jgi:hypothetical protein
MSVVECLMQFPAENVLFFSTFSYGYPEPILSIRSFWAKLAQKGVLLAVLAGAIPPGVVVHAAVARAARVVLDEIEAPVGEGLRVDSLRKTRLRFECFPYVCPEPVLVKRSF